MADSPTRRLTPLARQKRTQRSMTPGTLDGRVASAAPVPKRSPGSSGSEGGAALSNVLLIPTGGTVPPDTPYGTIIVEDATGLYEG